MADYTPRLRKILKAADCELIRNPRGSHQIWYSAATAREIAVPQKIKSRHTANAILKEAGLGKQF